MPVWASAAMIALLGIVSLTGMTFAPGKDTRLVAAIVPPWQTGGIGRAAAAGLAIVDLRWHGHVMILDTRGDAKAMTQLRAQGFWLLDATGVRGCDTQGVLG